MNKKRIYIFLKGRMGNQLFIYAFGRRIQKQIGGNTELIIDDSEVIQRNWENSLLNFNLPNVRYVHNRRELFSFTWIAKFILMKVAERFCNFRSSYTEKFKREKRIKPMLEFFGILKCENGFLEFNIRHSIKTFLINGYFQSERYFDSIKEEIQETFLMKNVLQYPNIDLLKASNSICVSVRLGDYVGNSLYEICGEKYWKEAISYILEEIPEPVFFVCSDNIEYVKNNLIDSKKYRVVFQDITQPVHSSLAAMAHCKHFIIANSSFSWWAQYLSVYKDKIVVAPNQWMLVDMPIDIYQEHWHLIDVKKHLGDKAL